MIGEPIKTFTELFLVIVIKTMPMASKINDTTERTPSFFRKKIITPNFLCANLACGIHEFIVIIKFAQSFPS